MGFFAPLFRLCLTPVGLPILAALDSTVIFFFPFGLDLALALMSARDRELAWLFPPLATAGSIVGAAFTFWVGRKVGEHGVERFVNTRRLRHIKARAGEKTAVSFGFLALLPPPFPFTAFTLMSGALAVPFRVFILSFAVARLIRGAVITGLALIYGRQLAQWMTSDAFEWIVGGFVVVALAGTGFSAWRVIRSSRHTRQPAAA